MGQPKITFYVDIVSPFGYLAHWMLRNSPTFKNVEVTLVPILLGGLIKQCGNVAPVQIKNKKEWINKERDRWASQFNIPTRADPPPGFPVSTVNAMRVLTALSLEKGVGQDIFAKAVDVLWACLWCPESNVLKELQSVGDIDKARGSDGEFDLKNAQIIQKLLAAVVGEDVAAKVVGQVGEKEVKDGLMSNTTRAFEAGAFGLPWFDCTNSKGEKDGFWGFDHLGQVVRFLGLEQEGDVERPLRAVL